MSTLKLCRICTKLVDRVGAKNIFSRTHQIMLQHIKEITGIKLEKCRELPHLICKQCQKDLSLAYDFLKRVVNAQAYFKTEKYKRNSAQIDDASKQKSTRIENKSGSPSPLAEILQSIKYDDFSAKNSEAIKCDKQLIGDNINDHEDQTVETISVEDFKPDIENLPYDVKTCVAQETIKADKERKKYKKTIKTEEKGSKADIENFQKDVESCVEEISEGQIKKGRKKYTKRLKTEEQPPQIFICELCGNHFKYPHHFIMHQRRHTGELQFQCELCPDKFLTSHQLKRHMRRHTGERPFPCKHCGRCFSDYSTRIKHERTHTNERPFACHQCDKAFTTSYVLKNHLLIHTGERSFRCDLCQRSFQRKTHLMTHFRSTMHKQLSEKANTQKEPIEVETNSNSIDEIIN